MRKIRINSSAWAKFDEVIFKTVYRMNKIRLLANLFAMKFPKTLKYFLFKMISQLIVEAVTWAIEQRSCSF